MTEDEIAEKAWKQYEQDKDAEAFFSNVSSVGYALGFRLPYYKALVLHKNGRDKDAAGYIALAISHFEGIVISTGGRAGGIAGLQYWRP